MRINLSSTCGNSPKNKFVEDYTLALLSFDFDNLKKMSTDNIKISIPDRTLIEGQAKLTDIKNYIKTDIEEITIDSSISHGKYGCALSEISDKKSSYKISFHYIFKNMKAELIEEATILMVEINNLISGGL